MRVGIFQSACAGLDLDGRIETLAGSVASDGDLDLVVCPELFTSGYNVGDDLRICADAVDGATFQKMSAFAAGQQVAVVYGYPELGDNGVLHNSAAFIAADGSLIANHRKRLNSPHSFEENYFVPGTEATLVDYGGVRIAIPICYELEFPESARAAALARGRTNGAD